MTEAVGDGFDDDDALDQQAVVYDDTLEGAARFALAVLDTEIMEQGRHFTNSAKLRYTAAKKLRLALLSADLRSR